ncbi:MAG: hypothetical protein IKF14_06300 [Atopobiaceae bacterium]|nr:hypothetical protein [Atopobiaceae bacterium]
MKKRGGLLAAFAMALLCVVALVGCGQQAQQAQESSDSVADDATYAEKTLRVISNKDAAPAELTVRFYDHAPNVPYFGLAAYKELVTGDKTTVESDGTTATFTATEGGVLVVDDVADTVSSDDLAAFRTYLEPQTHAGKPCGFLDYGAQYVRVKSLEYEGTAKPTTFDYAAYGIDLHVEDDDAYLPLACESDLLSEASMSALFFNGVNLYLMNGYNGDLLELDPTYYDQLTVDHERPQDMVDFAYAETCFMMDNLRGNTGRAMLDGLLKQKGLDAALEYDEFTSKVRDLLKSTDYYDYLAGLYGLSMLLSDGHTSTIDGYIMTNGEVTEGTTAAIEELAALMKSCDLESDYLKMANPSDGATPLQQRTEILGKSPDTYREKGSTAVIILDSFMDYDADGWRAHYEAGAPVPTGSLAPDMVGTFVQGIERARKNPKIENIVIDISCNIGGSDDVLSAMLALVTGKSEFKSFDTITGQPFTTVLEVDSLFDGSFQTNAFAKSRDFNYAVLTSQRSFSCGNYFPSRCKDAGIPIIGEQSGGGSFLVAALYMPEGSMGQASSAVQQLLDEAGKNVEGGTPVDVYLVKIDKDGTRDYSDFYDMKRLDEVMGELYGEEGLAEAA